MMKEIPGDIIEEILVKLPVKSLIRFRCVSKPWCSLINNPRFTRRQLNQHLTNSQHRLYHNSLLLQRFGIHIVDHEDEELASKISLYWNLEHVFPKRLPLPFNFDKQLYKISCCCDGILCLVFENLGIVLWNPRIGQYNKITLPDSYFGAYEAVGFGYDSSIDDYKVVRAPLRFRAPPRFISDHGSYFIVEKSQITPQVLTLKSNTWRTVDDYFPFTMNYCLSATTVNGGIYWFAHEDNTISDEDITTRVLLVCFDLAEEKFREVALPRDINCRDILPRLGLAGDFLCMLTKKESNTYFDLWVLKGDSDSTWAKLFTIPRFTGESFNYNFQPVCFAKNGAFLLNVGDNKFLMYDSKDDTFTKFWVQGIQSWSDLFVYADSLVSPCTSNVGTD